MMASRKSSFHPRQTRHFSASFCVRALPEKTVVNLLKLNSSLLCPTSNRNSEDTHTPVPASAVIARALSGSISFSPRWEGNSCNGTCPNSMCKSLAIITLINSHCSHNPFGCFWRTDATRPCFRRWVILFNKNLPSGYFSVFSVSHFSATKSVFFSSAVRGERKICIFKALVCERGREREGLIFENRTVAKDCSLI